VRVFVGYGGTPAAAHHSITCTTAKEYGGTGGGGYLYEGLYGWR
jgi:hypothetical protein